MAFSGAIPPRLKGPGVLVRILNKKEEEEQQQRGKNDEGGGGDDRGGSSSSSETAAKASSSGSYTPKKGDTCLVSPDCLCRFRMTQR